eukprot:scaffold6684_cov20-Prasinocladus_malaysianus.AAC.1
MFSASMNAATLCDSNNLASIDIYQVAVVLGIDIGRRPRNNLLARSHATPARHSGARIKGGDGTRFGVYYVSPPRLCMACDNKYKRNAEDSGRNMNRNGAAGAWRWPKELLLRFNVVFCNMGMRCSRIRATTSNNTFNLSSSSSSISRQLMIVRMFHGVCGAVEHVASWHVAAA